MSKSSSSRSSKSSSNGSRDMSKRHMPMSPPGGVGKRRTRYDEGGEIDW